MAKKPRPSSRPVAAEPDKASVTPERAARLYRLLQVLRDGPQTRGTLMRRLRLDIRGFYRDLDTLRKAGVEVQLNGRRYQLAGRTADAVLLLPFPDPHLTLGEALILARGRTRAHRLLKQQISQIIPARRPR